MSQYKLRFIFLIMAGLTLSACTGGRMGVGPPPAYLFSNYKAPLYFKSPEKGGLNISQSSKTGTSSGGSVVVPFTYGLGSFGFGDVSIEKAMSKAGMKEVDYADYEQKTFLGIYNPVKIILHGR